MDGFQPKGEYIQKQYRNEGGDLPMKKCFGLPG
jgi:hypothetical protein